MNELVITLSEGYSDLISYFQGWRHPWEGHGHGGHNEHEEVSCPFLLRLQIYSGSGASYFL